MNDTIPLRRFYRKVETPSQGDCARLLLDGKPAKTRAGSILSGPLPLMQAIADEWRAQGDKIAPASMPLTSIYSTAVDNSQSCAQWRDDIVAFANTDTLCYRTEHPPDLASRQAEVWDPYCTWFEARYGVCLMRTTGVMAVSQPESLVNAVEKELEAATPALLFGVYRASAICVSAILAFALWRGFASAEAIFAASRLDESFQSEKWGVDAEAASREAALRKDFDAIARYISLSSADG